MAISWSARRRITYFLITLVILVAGGVGAYYYYRPLPSCYDGRLNGDELGVDCGGSCPQVCPTEIQDLRVVWSRVFKIDEGRYDAAALLENPNPRHGVRVLPYSIRILDQDNVLVDVPNGSTFLNPKEQFVIFASRLNVGARIPVRAVFQLADTPLWQRVETPMPKLTSVPTSFTNLPQPRLLATITNESLQPLANIEVAAVLSDANQNALAVSSTLVETLGAGETKSMAFTWPKPLSAEPTNITFYPHLDLSKLPSS